MAISHPVSKFNAYTLQTKPWGRGVSRILASALESVEPGRAIVRYMQREGDHLQIGRRVYNLNDFKRVLVIGAGKAGAPMAQATADTLGDNLTQGIVLVKEGYAMTGNRERSKNLHVHEAGHPLPDQRGVGGTRQIIELLSNTQPDDLVICLVSGGGSALLIDPPDGLALADLQKLTAELLACGANIHEINTLRKHLDRVKGGKLARLVSPAKMATLILSDVVGDSLDMIASGPTVPDPTTFHDAYQVLKRYHLLEQAPATVLTHLQRGMDGEIRETPKPGDPLFDNIQNIIVGSNSQAAQAALEQAGREGYHPLLLTTWLQGEARQVGRVLAAIARQIADTGQPLTRPACLVAGGETTVTLKGNGLGGRNQELALGAVSGLAGLPEVALVSLATDGGDGPSNAAGAVITGETLERAKNAGLSPDDYLARNDAYNFFKPLGDLLITGPTLTNVNDLAFIFAF